LLAGLGSATLTNPSDLTTSIVKSLVKFGAFAEREVLTCCKGFFEVPFANLKHFEEQKECVAMCLSFY